MVKTISIAALVCTLSVSSVFAKEFEEHKNLMNHGDGHLMDMGGAMVMGQNADTLPGGCDKIAATKEITVRAGHKYSEKFPGTMWAFDQQEYKFEPCTKLTVNFINDDEIRHQWMMHGLPKYLYPKGMFHLEVSGPGSVSGTLILPPGDKTYLVHCDIAQHMEKGMKAQLKVGKGSGDLPSVPGISTNTYPDDYSGKPFNAEAFAKQEAAGIAAAAAEAEAATAAAKAAKASGNAAPADDGSFLSGVSVVGLAIGILVGPLLAKRFKGMSTGEVVATIFEWISLGIGFIVDLISKLIKMFSSNKSLPLPDNK